MATAQELAREARKETLDPRAVKTRAALKEAALALAADGARGPSVRDITERARVSRSSFYTQFASMGELNIALFEDALARVTDRDTQEREADGVPAGEVVHRSVQRLVEHVDALRNLYLMDLPETSAAHLRLVDSFAQELRASRAISRAPRVGLSVDAASSFIAGAVLHLLRAWLIGQIPGTPASITEQITLLLPPWLSDESDNQTIAEGRLP